MIAFCALARASAFNALVRDGCVAEEPFEESVRDVVCQCARRVVPRRGAPGPPQLVPWLRPVAAADGICQHVVVMVAVRVCVVAYVWVYVDVGV